MRRDVIQDRLRYYQRVARAYLLPGKSQLTFWHDTPRGNPAARADSLGAYYMDFSRKADYHGHHDAAGIPMLDYHGQIGLQYNPIAVAQWALGNYNLFVQGGDEGRRKKFLMASDWLLDHLEPNARGVWVWNHDFDWEYRTRLIAPWHSGLAQGQGISVLVRAFLETGDAHYLAAAQKAFGSFLKLTDEGGVSFVDQNGDVWFEEYIVAPPTHILNGFIWAAWGVYDYYLATKSEVALELWRRAVQTLKFNLSNYDLGFWSLYELSGTMLPMVASRFYHRLHVVQLRVMHKLTGESTFADYADKWESDSRSRGNRTRALCYKSAFKLCYY